MAIPSWQAVSSANGWTLSNISNYNAGYRPIEFLYDPVEEVVKMRGIGKVTAAGTWSITMPARLKPKFYDIQISSTDTSTTQQFLRLDVTSGGVIQPVGTVGQGASDYINFLHVKWYII